MGFNSAFKGLSNATLSPILHVRMTALFIESMPVNLLSLVSSLPEVQALGKHRLTPLICVVFRSYVTARDTWKLEQATLRTISYDIFRSHAYTPMSRDQNINSQSVVMLK